MGEYLLSFTLKFIGYIKISLIRYWNSWRVKTRFAAQFNYIKKMTTFSYMTGIARFNQTLKIQGNTLNLIKTRFIIYLPLLQNFCYTNLGRRDEDLFGYCQYINTLHSDLNQIFKIILHLAISKVLFCK